MSSDSLSSTTTATTTFAFAVRSSKRRNQTLYIVTTHGIVYIPFTLLESNGICFGWKQKSYKRKGVPSFHFILSFSFFVRMYSHYLLAKTHDISYCTPAQLPSRSHSQTTAYSTPWRKTMAFSSYTIPLLKWNEMKIGWTRDNCRIDVVVVVIVFVSKRNEDKPKTTRFDIRAVGTLDCGCLTAYSA